MKLYFLRFFSTIVRKPVLAGVLCCLTTGMFYLGALASSIALSASLATLDHSLAIVQEKLAASLQPLSSKDLPPLAVSPTKGNQRRVIHWPPRLALAQER